MILRGLVWLLVLAALGAAMALDRAPPDPVRRRSGDDAARTNSLVMLICSAAGVDPAVHAIASRPPPWFLVTPQIMAFTDSPARIRPYEQLREALALAEIQGLAAPVRFQTTGVFFDLWGTHVEVHPVGDIQGVYRRLPPHVPATDLNSQDLWITWTPGAALTSGDEEDLEILRILWQSYRQALGGPQVDLGQRPGGAYFSIFYPTHALNPLDDPSHDEVLEGLARLTPGFRLMRVSGGIIVTGNRAMQADVQQWWNEGRIVRAARELSWGSDAQRASARRVALCEDDPQLAGLALVDLQLTGARGANWDRFPDELVWSESIHPTLELLQALLEVVTPEGLVREIERIGRAPGENRVQSIFLRLALVHPSTLVRRAARETSLARLPSGVLGGLQDTALVGWAPAEREEFCNALVDRLREELSQGGERARYAVRQVHRVLVTARTLPSAERSRSRMLELGANLFCDERFGPEFRRLQTGAILAAAEVAHDIRPEMRQAACAFLATLSQMAYPQVQTSLYPLLGDPYTADLLRELEPR